MTQSQRARALPLPQLPPTKLQDGRRSNFHHTVKSKKVRIDNAAVAACRSPQQQQHDQSHLPKPPVSPIRQSSTRLGKTRRSDPPSRNGCQDQISSKPHPKRLAGGPPPPSNGEGSLILETAPDGGISCRPRPRTSIPLLRMSATSAHHRRPLATLSRRLPIPPGQVAAINCRFQSSTS